MRRRSDQPQEHGATRIWPLRGQLFTVGDIRGDWRPTGTAEGSNFFGVLWQDRIGRAFWIALHDFDSASQRHLLDQCARADRGRGPHGW